MFKVYLLTNQNHTLNYTGSTGLEVDQRLRLHNNNTGCQYTKHRGPWRLIAYVSGFTSRSAACQFERQVKRTRIKKTRVNESKIKRKLRIFSKVYMKNYGEELLFHMSRRYEKLFEVVDVNVITFF